MDALLVEATRGDRVESRHAGSAVVIDAHGAVLFQAGDIDAPFYTRSTVKALLALPLVETGAADRLGLTDAELALACASHVGEPVHVETAASMLHKAGQQPGCLECGVHWPTSRAGQRALVEAGAEPSALHNNCSGKHAGFVCLAVDAGVAVQGYVRPEHQTMRQVTAALADMTGARLDDGNRAIDGCAIPTYAIPLRALALGFARFGAGIGMHPDRHRAASRLRAAVAANPVLVAGPGRFDTRVMQAFGGAVFSKMGAEGTHVLSLPEQGLGIAVKCADGATRAAELVAAALLARHVPATPEQQALLQTLVRPRLQNWNGTEVGTLRPAGALASS
ncbi:asparaginase [Lichenicola sp.]|uniref:asparaginase n=1 Tax=Lichenicola sp. TaxID=2804529 RepID=UPI003B00A224